MSQRKSQLEIKRSRNQSDIIRIIITGSKISFAKYGETNLEKKMVAMSKNNILI